MRKFFKNLKNDQRGFTLVELSIVLIIIGILTAIAVPAYNSWKETAGKTACDANKRVIQTAILQAELDGELDKIENGTITFDKLVELGYFEEKPKCPNGGTYSIEDSDNDGIYEVKCDVHKDNGDTQTENS